MLEAGIITGIKDEQGGFAQGNAGQSLGRRIVEKKLHFG
jgi:hypothetical protein